MFCQAAAALLALCTGIDHPARRRVFMDALFARVRDRHDNRWLDQMIPNQSLRGFIDTPFDTGKRSCRVENILAVLQIQNRVTLPREATVPTRQIDQHVAAISENLRSKTGMFLNISGERVSRHENETL